MRFHGRPDEYFQNNPEGWRLLTENVTSALRQGEAGGLLYLPIRSAEEAGMNGHMAKPLDFATLGKEIERYLE